MASEFRLTLIYRRQCLGGWVERYTHFSSVLDCQMQFSLYLPPALALDAVPVLYWLSDIEESDEDFLRHSGVAFFAAQLGIAIVCCDTSPRGSTIPNLASQHVGLGTSFYVDATEPPWRAHFQMYSYVSIELPGVIEFNFHVNGLRSIAGLGMGGFGALVVGLTRPDSYLSISAFAPFCRPTKSDKLREALRQYLGPEGAKWRRYDTKELIQNSKCWLPTLIDVGFANGETERVQDIESLAVAANKSNFPLTLNLRLNYDNGYFFVLSFIESHLQFHGNYLLD